MTQTEHVQEKIEKYKRLQKEYKKLSTEYESLKSDNSSSDLIETKVKELVEKQKEIQSLATILF